MGKNIVNAISQRHLAKDKMYFKKKTYEEFVEDPLGVEYKRKQVFQDPRVRETIIKAGLLKNRVEE
jgi:hypothetical protein